MNLCFRKCHPKRILGLITWLAIIILVFHELSIITVSVQVHPQQFARARGLISQDDNETEPDRTPHTTLDEVMHTDEHVKMVRGHFRNTTGYLTIGLCTVPRQNAFYLPTTLQTLIANTTSLQQQQTVIVIYLGSGDHAWVAQVLKLVDDVYKEQVDSGMIQVIQPDPRVYPDFSNLTRRTYGDSTDRITWRTKQNVDYAYIFSHSREISKYYIHIEDDVTAVPGYFDKIQSFVEMRNNKDDQWFCLEFTRIGFIGKLFRSSDLTKMKDYFLMFQFEKPGDLLLNDLKVTMTQFKSIYSMGSVFKHIGRHSSLTNKTHVIRDSWQKPGFLSPGFSRRNPSFGRVFNPPAKIKTTLVPYSHIKPEDAYNIGGHKMFWATGAKYGDTFDIILDDKANLRAATVSTGHPIKKTNKLLGAKLKYGTTLQRDGSCNADKHLRSLKDGYAHFSAFIPVEIKCLSVYVTKSQSSYVIISKIVLAF